MRSYKDLAMSSKFAVERGKGDTTRVVYMFCVQIK